MLVCPLSLYPSILLNYVTVYSSSLSSSTAASSPPPPPSSSSMTETLLYTLLNEERGFVVKYDFFIRGENINYVRKQNAQKILAK